MATQFGTREPGLAPKAGQSWQNVFMDDFSTPESLETNWRHPMGRRKWKWDAKSNKEIHWEPYCAQIVPDPDGGKSFLRVCVFSDWFHRIDRLATKEKFGYGYYEARCRFQGAEGMHSAFWLLPDGMWDNPVPPGQIDGGIEIDVVEHRAKDGSGADMSTQGNTAVHWGGYGANHRSVAFKLMNLPDRPLEWATYGLLHEPGGLRWYWNGKEVNSARVWSPMPNGIYFSTEVNESGGWAGQDLSSYGPIDKPAGYIEVDYCGFWQLSDSTFPLSVAVPSLHPGTPLTSSTKQCNSETVSPAIPTRPEDAESAPGDGSLEVVPALADV